MIPITCFTCHNVSMLFNRLVRHLRWYGLFARKLEENFTWFQLKINWYETYGGQCVFDMLWTKNQYDAWKDCLFAQDNFPLMQPKSEAYMENWGRFAPKAQENLSFCQLKSNMKLTLRLSFCADAGENLTWFQLKIDMN